MTGAYLQLRILVLAAIKQITQKARLEDNRRCREVMKAFRSLAALGEEATSDSLNLWQKKHKKHRGVHISEIADLQKTAGMQIDAQSERTLAKIRTEQENKIFIDKLKQKQLKRQRSLKRRAAACKISADPTKLLKQKMGRKERYDKFKVVHPKHKKQRTKVHNDEEDVVEPHE